MHTPRRNRCDEILALIDRCLDDYDLATTTAPMSSASRREAPLPSAA